MSILNGHEIRRRVKRKELILNPRLDKNGDAEVEAASYDMRAGVFIWRNPDMEKSKGEVETHYLDLAAPPEKQFAKTIHPGQMIFAITQEELFLPEDVCGTVYSRNKLARDGILALNAGHVDPGYQGPIAIRLINLRSVPYSIRLGEPIYTVVFHHVEYKTGDTLLSRRQISMEEIVGKYTDSANLALCNTLYDLSLTRSFVREEEFSHHAWKWVRNNLGKIASFLAAMMAAIYGLWKALPFIKILVDKLSS